MARIIDIFDVEGTNKSLLTLEGVSFGMVKKGSVLRFDDKKIEIDALPIMTQSSYTEGEVTVGVLDNILDIGDSVEIER